MDQFFLRVEGTWKMENAEVYERWHGADGSYAGEVFILDGRDTLNVEFLTLQHQGSNVIYTALVPDQNEGIPVSFTLVSSDSLHWAFENPDHDFPTRIEYHILGDDSLLAVVSGKEEGKEKSIRFNYRKQ